MNQDVFLTLVLGTLLHFRSPREKKRRLFLHSAEHRNPFTGRLS